MKITFFKDTATGQLVVNAPRAPKPGHQFNIFETFDLWDFLKSTEDMATRTKREAEEQANAEKQAAKDEAIKTAATQAIKLCRSQLTVSRSKEGLSSFFNAHFKPEWFEIPMPPNELKLEELEKHYTHFKIPKASGGFRQIDAPDELLKEYLSALKSYFENTLQIICHDACHAYTKYRSTLTAAQAHQLQDTHWYLKLDMKNFFPAHTLEYVMETLSDIYPIGFLMDDQNYKKKLRHALSFAFLNDSLPQGTPLSPTLTNICMVPIDYDIKKALIAHGPFVYTRYADDITISCKHSFRFIELVEMVTSILKEHKAPFFLNKDKTKYQSRNGSNWILGMMLNKDNQLTIGYRKVKAFKCALYNLIQKHDNWSAEDKQELGGLISYYRMVNPESTNGIIKFYEEKYKVSIKELLKIV